MPKVSRQKHFSLLGIVAGWTLLALVIYRYEEKLQKYLDLPFLKWEYAWQDLVAKRARPAAASSDIFFLAMDPASYKLDQLWEDELAASPTLQLMKRRPPWSRKVYADVLDRLADAGARVVAFDVLFPDEAEHDATHADTGDAALRSSLERHQARAIVGSQIDETGISGGINPTSRTILPVGSEYGDQVGFVNTWPDEDGVVRRARFHIRSTELKNWPPAEGERVFDSLAARIAQKAGLGAKVPQDHLPRLIRYAYQSETLLKSQKPPSLYQIFVPTFWENNYGNGAFFRDKIVLVGPEGRSNKDTLESPFGQIAGAAFHLNVINAIINGEFLRRTPLGIDLLLILLAGTIAAALGWFVRNPWLRVLLLVMSAVGWFGIGVAFYNAAWVVPILSPMLAILGSGALFSLAEQIFDRLEKAKLRRTLDRYVSKDVVKELVDNPESWLNTLGGQRKPISILFSDVRGFTTMAESSDPVALVKQLNEYFDHMVEIVFKDMGTLDKFVGDAVMAHWGSITTEGVQADARRAVSTALQMRRSLALLNPEWKKRGMLEMKFGIGVNSGDAIVGSLGSKGKAEVSAISDAVNLASRLEGVNKQYGTDLCIGEAVVRLVRDAFVLRSLDLIIVQGKTKPVEIFTVLKEREAGVGDPPWLSAHEEAVRSYRAGDFAAAERLWREVLAQCPGDSVTEVFLERCAALQKTPPEGEWDGVFEMKTK